MWLCHWLRYLEDSLDWFGCPRWLRDVWILSSFSTVIGQPVLLLKRDKVHWVQYLEVRNFELKTRSAILGSGDMRCRITCPKNISLSEYYMPASEHWVLSMHHPSHWHWRLILGVCHRFKLWRTMIPFRVIEPISFKTTTLPRTNYGKMKILNTS